MIPALANGIRERKENDDPRLVFYLKTKTLLVRTLFFQFFFLNDKT